MMISFYWIKKHSYDLHGKSIAVWKYEYTKDKLTGCVRWNQDRLGMFYSFLDALKFIRINKNEVRDKFYIEYGKLCAQR